MPVPAEAYSSPVALTPASGIILQVRHNRVRPGRARKTNTPHNLAYTAGRLFIRVAPAVSARVVRSPTDSQTVVS